MTRVLLVCGSLRAGSTNAAAIRAADEAALPGVETTVYDELASLPHFNPDDDPDGGPVHPAVMSWRAQLADADAVLFCTPEYAGALPGVLKNALEWTVGGASLHAKPAGYVNASTWPTGAADAHASLRKVFGWIGATVIDDACRHVAVPRADVDDAGDITDPAIRAGIADVLAALADAAREQS